MKAIFLSHNYSDQKAREIAWSLRKIGERADSFSLITASEMLPGREIGVSLFEQIKKASLVIAVLNETSSSALLELGYALGTGKVVLLVADMRSNLPPDLSSIQAIDYSLPVDEIAVRLSTAIEKLERNDRLRRPELPKNLDEMLRLQIEYPEKFEQISAYDFERAVRNAFLERGYEIQDADPSQDFGFDFRSTKGGQTTLVEVKKYSSNGKVSIDVVQQLLGAIHAYDVSKALLICTSDFTDSARGFASRYANELELWTAEELARFTGREPTRSGVPTDSNHE